MGRGAVDPLSRYGEGVLLDFSRAWSTSNRAYLSQLPYERVAQEPRLSARVHGASNVSLLTFIVPGVSPMRRARGYRESEEARIDLRLD